MHRFFPWTRQAAPVWRDEANGLWAVTRHADVLDVERRSDVFSSRGCYRANVTPEETNTISLDDPEHLQQRRIVNRRFTPRSVEAHHAFLRDRIDQLITAVGDRG